MTCSSPNLAVPLLVGAPSSEAMLGSTFSFAGEIGMVSSGTGELGLFVVGAMTEVDMTEVRVWKAVRRDVRCGLCGGLGDYGS